MMKERPYREGRLKISDQRELEVGGNRGFMNHMDLKSLKFGAIPLFARPRLRDIQGCICHIPPPRGIPTLHHHSGRTS
jgi:hypothetical protein